MPKRKQKKPRLSVSVSKQQKAVLQEIADRSEVSLARVVQQAIKEFIEHHPQHHLTLFEKPIPPKG